MSVKIEESDDAILLETQSGSLFYGKANGGENIGRRVVWKKGPWTAAEDAILLDYVRRHGDRNWNAVQKHSGLFRCGKSCRMRWANHLRPNLKKGTFTEDEELLIAQLHAKMGNKWARMAAHLPGRTDNEIKNYWNTRIKRRRRAGLPLYPPVVLLQAMQENQSLDSSGLNTEDKRFNGRFQSNCNELAGSEFYGLKANYSLWPYAQQLSDMSSSTSLMKGPASSQICSFISSVMHRRLQCQDSVHLSSNFDGNIGNRLPQFNIFKDDPCDKDGRSFGLSFLYDSDLTASYHFPFEEIQGSHTLLNGNLSASKPMSGAVKLELPSLQYTESDFGSCGTSFLPPPWLNSVDTFMQSEKSPPRNSGLLDALVHEANTLRNAKSHLSDKSSDSSTLTPCDIRVGYSSTLNLCDNDWEEYSDSISTYGHSASTNSIFNECTPTSGGGSSLSEYARADIFHGHNVKSEPNQVWTPEEEMEVSTRISSPSVLLEVDSFHETRGKRHTSDMISILLGSDRASACTRYLIGSCSSVPVPIK